jgi:hypothetical protein
MKEVAVFVEANTGIGTRVAPGAYFGMILAIEK